MADEPRRDPSRRFGPSGSTRRVREPHGAGETRPSAADGGRGRDRQGRDGQRRDGQRRDGQERGRDGAGVREHRPERHLERHLEPRTREPRLREPRHREHRTVPDTSERPGRAARAGGAVAVRERPAALAVRTAVRADRSAPDGLRPPARHGAPTRPVPPTRAPAGPPPARAPRRRRRAVRVVVTLLSAVIFALSGTAWAALSSGISTSSSALGSLVNAPDGATDVLLVGTDSRTDAQGHPLPPEVLAALGASDEGGVLNTDTMILVRVPNDGRRAVAFSIPRDSYVPIPGTTRRDKINSAFPGAKAAAADRLVASGVSDPREIDVRSSEAGRQALVSAVQSLTGLTVDHYAEINLLGFATLTQAVGGVDVCLTNAVDEPKSGAHFTAGPHTVAGHDALAFVRQRYGLPQGDLDRVRRQQAFLASLSHKVLSAGTLTDPVTLTRLLTAVRQSVVLDGDWDLLRFAQQMRGLTGGAVAFMTIPTGGTETTDQGDVLRVDPAEVQRYVADAIGDEQRGPAGAPAPAGVPVDVRNASDAAGAAARVAAVLTAHGFTRTAAANADPASKAAAVRSTVLVGPGADDGGALVATTLGGLPTRPDPAVAPGTVRVLLAPDYAGPGAGPLAPVAAAPAAPGAAAPAPAPPPPITADGVPCVD